MHSNRLNRKQYLTLALLSAALGIGIGIALLRVPGTTISIAKLGLGSSIFIYLLGLISAIPLAWFFTKRMQTPPDTNRQPAEFYQLAFQDSPLALCHFDETGTITQYNNNFAKLTGLMGDSRSTANIRDLFVGDSAHRDVIDKVRQGKHSSYSGRLREQEAGLGSHVQACYTPLCSEKRLPMGGLATIFDNSAEIGAQNEIGALKHKLAAAQKIESIGALAGGLAHDFNNMLSPIIGYSQMALEELGEGQPDIVDYLNQIIQSGQLAGDIAKQLLTFARSDNGDSQVFHPAPLIKEAVRSISPTLPTSVSLNHDIPARSQLLVDVDPIQLHQCIHNLIINARDALPDGEGRIEIHLSEQDATHTCTSCNQTFNGVHTVINIQDNGSGIAPEVINKIFQPFFTTKAIGRGSGMGLAMTHGILHAAHGHVVVNTELGRGTEVQLHFPVPQNRMNEQTKPRRGCMT